MKQIELFNSENYSTERNKHYLGVHDWELDSEQTLFDNTEESSQDKGSGDNDELFDNKNNITKLAVSEYSPAGTAAKGNKYYRFSYREGNRTKHIHIKGGHTGNKLAIKNKELVQAWIREKVALKKIIEWIKDF